MKRIVVIIMAMLLAFGQLAGCRTMTGRSAGEIIDDSTIVTEINAKIIKDSELKFFKIDVDSSRGNVVLKGTVKSKEAEERLIKIAREVKGVKSVKSNLEVKK
jgi:osmotically-inducible protein OsmY